MKAGWKTRIDERRYFEEKRMEWRKRVIDKQLMQARLEFDEQQREVFLKSFLTQDKGTVYRV